MPGGYFNDGNGTHVELGEHAFATATAYRRNVIREPYATPYGGAARVMDSGGGILDVEATGQRVRANMGDAERYIYELFRALAFSGAGDLGVEDNRIFRQVYGDSVCVGATGEVRAFKFADMRFSFLSPEKSGEPAWGGPPPDAPLPYAGTSTAQDYAAGGVTLGIGVSMRIELIRSWPLREIPRARGARTTEPHRAAQIRFIVQCGALANAVHLAAYLENLARQIGPRHAQCSFDNFVVYEESTTENRPSQREVFQQLQDFATEMPARLRKGGGVVLFGRPGAGKDHLAFALMYWAILQHGFTVEWVSGPELYVRARQLIRDQASELAFVRSYVKPQVLAISDPVPPKGDTSAYATDVVFRILDRRYMAMKSTWATMNVRNGHEAEGRLAPPIVDRLRHDAVCLECNWESYRQRSANK